MTRAAAKKAQPQAMTIVEAMEDPALFGRHFRDPEAWTAWRSFLAALLALPMDDQALALYQACTGRTDAPTEPAKEGWLVIGRRGGKSRILALIAVYLATFRDWRPFLAPGEKGFLTVIASDRRQARSIMGYVRAFLVETPMLAPLVLKDNAEDIELAGGIVIEVATCSFRTIRGRTLIACLCDEAAFWADDSSANPDTEVIAAVKPAMATTGGLLLVASSPYGRRGALWQAYKRHFGKSGPVLVWQAATRTMHPGLPQSIVDEAEAEDPASAAAEYGGQFRTDIETFVSREALDAVVVPGRHELPKVTGTRYAGFVDPSGGSQDAMTLAIAHAEGQTAILDAVREVKPPFSPEAVVVEFAAVLKSYGLSEVTGDRYAGEWPRERFKLAGINYNLAEKPRSDLYRDLLPMINSGRCELLDHPRLIAQLAGLERRTARGGKDSIDHAPGGHDDVANAAAGALVMVGGKKSALETWLKLGQMENENALTLSRRRHALIPAR